MSRLGYLGLAVAVLLLAAAPSIAATPQASVGHYVPQAGDSFHYYETWYLNSGTGEYLGYTESEYTNGTIQVTAVNPNGTEAASYSNTNYWSNNTGSAYAWTSSGTFTFSATTFHYVHGTDNQTGYTNPYVWFYINNTLANGTTLYLLNTQCHVVSTETVLALPLSPTGYVTTISTEGNGSFERDDVYGMFSASYTWLSYFDPGTGYLVGYSYQELDTNPNGTGFRIVDTVQVTSTSYPLQVASNPSPPGSPNSGCLSETEVVALVVVVVVVVVVLVAVLVSRSRRRLPQHSATGRVDFGPPAAPPPMGVPPPVHLTPSGQPAVQQIVLRETVKVPCRYCGTLMDSTATVCPNCGAPRT